MSRFFTALSLLMISGSLLAQICPAPGSDGTTYDENTYYPGEGTSSSGSTNVVIGSARADADASTTAIAANDLVLLVQMQDASINNTNTTAYGDGSTGAGYTALNSAGYYEFAEVTNVSGSTLTLADPLTYTYRSAGATASTGRRTFQVIRVPQHDDLILSGNFDVVPWNGRTGGVWILDVAGTLAVDGVTVDGTGAGFRGGGSYEGDTSLLNGTDVTFADDGVVNGNDVFGSKGEGIAGTPELISSNTANNGFSGISSNLTSSTQGFPSADLGYQNGFDASKGAPGNAGGGGGEHNAGGGGGSNAGFGGVGGNTFGRYRTTDNGNCVMYEANYFGCDGDGSRPEGGLGGVELTSATVGGTYEARLFMGGGGGAGSNNDAEDNPSIPQSSGGNGGAIILIRSYNLVNVGGGLTIINNGENGQATGRDGAGAGGAGGSVLLLTNPAAYAFVSVDVIGGEGGNTGLDGTGGTTTGTELRDNETQGPAGGGGGGSVLLPSGITIGSIDVSGGAPGENFPDVSDTSLSNPLDAEAGDGVVSFISYDPLTIDSEDDCVDIDYGDAEASYAVNFLSDGARHSYGGDSLIYLGSNSPDEEVEGQASDTADGDDTAGSMPDDEDGVVFIGLIEEDLTTNLTVTASTTSLLSAWIDYNQDGDWTGPNEQVFTDEPLNAGANALSFAVPAGISGGHSYARFRVDGAGGLSSTGKVNGGEVEDYLVRLVDESLDYGDAPDSYGTLFASDGARHAFSNDLFLGSTEADADTDGFADGTDDSSGAATDDDSGGDEGISQLLSSGSAFPALEIDGTSYTIDIDLTNTSVGDAYLYAWIDFDNNGTFDEDEMANSGPITVANTDTTATVTWGSLPGISTGSTYMRFRITSELLTAIAGGEDERASGYATDGEVEDYGVLISESEDVYFEAECGIVGSEWVANFDSNAVEGVNLEPINRRTGTLAGAELAEDILEYQLVIPFPDTYDIYMLAEVGAAGESIFYSINNNVWFGANLTTDTGGAYQWFDLNENTQNGTYQPLVTTVPNEAVTVYFSRRENDLRIDRFAYLPADSPLPLGQGDVVGSCFDFGDAPDTSLDSTGTGDYITLFANTISGPFHPVDQNSSVFLGAIAPDTETDGLQTTGADGDDVNDEGAAQLISTANGDAFPELLATDTSFSFEIDVTNNKAVNATVVAWIDFDRDGDFEVGEQADTNPTITASSGSTQTTLTWTGLTGLTNGELILRTRISTDTELTTKGSTDVVIDGEVEDHQIVIGLYDFSDGPSDYSSVSHFESTDITLGSLIDFEAAAFNSADADGDDLDGTDDEDGVTQFLNVVTEAQFYTVEVACNDNDGSDLGATVYGWIDFDGDDALGNDANEFTSAACVDADNTNDGTATLLFSGFNSSLPSSNDEVLARFRITTDTLTSADAATNASDGEVEDYIANIINQNNFGVCPSDAFLVQNATPDLLGINLFLGVASNLQTDMAYEDGSAGTNSNAWGFNSFDNFLYGNDVTIQSGTILRVGASGGLTRFGPFPELTTPNVTRNLNAGDVDSSGVLHLTDRRVGTIYRVDVNPASSTYMTYLGSSIIFGGEPVGSDMAFSPLDGLMYGINENGNLVSLNATSGVMTVLVDFTGVVGFPGGGSYGGTYFDAAGFLYLSFNDTGVVYRLDLRDPSSIIGSAGNLGALGDFLDEFGQPTGNTTINDGARCPTAPILGDYGDAPTAAQTGFASSYPTLLDDNGARHNITDSNTLFLGSAGDNEFNGQPSLAADSDDSTDDADEDGVVFANLIAANTSDLTITASAAGTLNAWMDFNRDGDWDDSGEQIATDVALASGANTLSVAIPISASEGFSYARFRLSSDTGLLTTGPASDGEVEDYQITILPPLDYGDVPVTTAGNYDDTDADGDVDGDDTAAAHTVGNGVILGLTVDTDAQIWGDGVDDNGDATDDDTEGNVASDEDGISTFPILESIATTYSLELTIDNGDAANAANIYAWIDFDSSGSFDEDERAILSAGTVNPTGLTVPASASGTVNLDWTGLTGLVADDTYVRVRITTQDLDSVADGSAADDASTGLASDGEVEDYQLSIVDGNAEYSDGPADYSSVSHSMSSDITLGSLIDYEAAAFNSVDADGDDLDGTDDEDGVTQFLNIVTEAQFYTVEVACNDNDGSDLGATVYGWIDFDSDNSLGNDPDEFTSAACVDANNTNDGSATLVFSGFNSLFAGTDDEVLARFRITTDTLTSVDSATNASDGEVEDYIANIIDQDSFGSCPGDAFLVQTATPDLFSINLVAGTSTVLESNMTYEDGSAAVPSNNWGYNVLDNHLYGGVDQSGNPGIVLRIGSDAGTFSITRFGPFAELVGLSGRNTGDVDSNGVLHMSRSGETIMHRVDVNPASPTYMTYLDSFALSGSAIGTDLAFNPLDGLMYGVNAGGLLISLDTATGTVTTIASFASVPGFPGASNYGANYFDVSGFLYVGQNNSGDIYRFDLRVPSNIGTVGSLEDYVDFFGQPTGAVSINDGARCPNVGIFVDYGDAPTAAQTGFASSYPTLLDDNGARHDITDSNTLFLGSAGDNEFNGQPTLAADGDDTTDDADEDGINLLTILNEGDAATIQVTASGSATLDAWMDFNLDGDWDDAGEQIFTDQAVVAGSNVFSITLPASISTGTSYARFRLSSDTGLLPTGPASDGEVEDMQIQLVRVFDVQGTVFNDLNSDGVLDAGEEGIEGVEIVLESSGGVCIAVSTDATGLYVFEDVGVDAYTIYEADGADTPVPAICPPVEADPSGYLSSTANSISGVVVSTADVTGQNFGDVLQLVFTPNNEDVIFPAGVIYYPHRLITVAEGSATFAIVETGEPTPTNWETNLFIDTDCSGDFGSGDTLLSGAQSLAANAELCLLVQVISPFDADATDIHIATATATFDYAGTVVPTQMITVVDTTTVLSEGDGQLRLTKFVENLSCQTGGAGFPCDYDTGSRSSDNNAQPGDLVRYSLFIENIGVESISDIEIFDVIPAYTALFDPDDLGEPNGTQPLDVNCGYPNTRGADFAFAPSLVGCILIAPNPTPAYTDAADNDIADNPATENAPGYSGSLQWQLDGDLGAGESVTIVFDVKVL